VASTKAEADRFGIASIAARSGTAGRVRTVFVGGKFLGTGAGGTMTTGAGLSGVGGRTG
jgi:hypothetical protein